MLKSQSLRSLQMSYVRLGWQRILFACVIAFPDLGLGDIIGLLGLGSVAIGFAFQDIFKNFFGRRAVAIERAVSFGRSDNC